MENTPVLQNENIPVSPAPAEQPAKARRRRVKETPGDVAYYVITYIVLGLLALIVLYPLWFVVVASFSSAEAVMAGKVYLWPVDLDFSGYAMCFQRSDIWIGYANTIWYTI